VGGDEAQDPLTTGVAGVGAKAVRGCSMFETSMVDVIFPDGTNRRDARERVLEYLNYAKDRLPAGVETKPGAGRRIGLAAELLHRPDEPAGVRIPVRFATPVFFSMPTHSKRMDA